MILTADATFASRGRDWATILNTSLKPPHLFVIDIGCGENRLI